MNKQVWKYKLSPDKTTYDIPKNAKILCAMNQYNELCIWAEVNPEAETEERVIEVFGTGHTISYDIGTERKYISSVSLDGGLFIFHVYERIN